MLVLLITQSYSHRTAGLEMDLKDHPVPILGCRQGWQPLSQVAQGLIHPGPQDARTTRSLAGCPSSLCPKKLLWRVLLLHSHSSRPMALSVQQESRQGGQPENPALCITRIAVARQQLCTHYSPRTTGSAKSPCSLHHIDATSACLKQNPSLILSRFRSPCKQ